MDNTVGLDILEDWKFFSLPGIEPRVVNLLPRIISSLSYSFSIVSFTRVDAGCVRSACPLYFIILCEWAWLTPRYAKLVHLPFVIFYWTESLVIKYMIRKCLILCDLKYATNRVLLCSTCTERHSYLLT
jgi:hypothetical protein